jgi:hypothetical protein
MTQLRLIAALVGVLALVGAYFYGRADGGTSCQASALTEYQKGVQHDAKVDRQVNRMDNPAIDRALSRWMQ